MGSYTVEWDAAGTREYRFFPHRNEAADFAAKLASEEKVLVRRTNLEDVFIELTGRKEGL